MAAVILLPPAGHVRAEYCALYLTTEPPGAEVYIDGRRVGTSPYAHQVNHPEQLKVRIVRKGDEYWEKVVDMPMNNIEGLHVDLVPAPKR